MFRNVLKIIAIADWVTPTTAIIQHFTKGPSHTFFIPEDCGCSGHEITAMLQRYGVRTWSGMIINNTIMFTVGERQAQWAQYLLLHHDIPIASGLLDANSARSARHPQRGLLSDLAGDWLGLASKPKHLR